MLYYIKTPLYYENWGVVMDKNSLISSFNITLYKFRETHMVGSVQHFKKPCIGYIKKGSAQFLYSGKSFYATEGDLVFV